MKKKKKKKKHAFSERVRRNPKVIVIILIASGILLIGASYAWFSASLNVKVKFFDVTVSTDRGLFISLDGINFSESVDISLDSIIYDLYETYADHTNQWSAGGLWPVSSNGIKDSNSDHFDIYIGQVSRKIRNEPGVRYLSVSKGVETHPSTNNQFIAFDLFLKNVSGSPFPDNLYFTEDTLIDFDEEVDEETREEMSHILDSMRLGLVKMDTVPHNTDPFAIQQSSCNGRCEYLIYEPNSHRHTPRAIDSALQHGVVLIDGVYSPTYAIINPATRIRHISGQVGSGIPLDPNYFKLQETYQVLGDKIFELANGITKFRAYVWIEGQDMDSLETYSSGAPIDIYLNFEKDTAGYE